MLITFCITFCITISITFFITIFFLGNRGPVGSWYMSEKQNVDEKCNEDCNEKESNSKRKGLFLVVKLHS